MTQSYLPLFELTRGEIVESLHSGAIAVVDSHGKLTAWYGNPNQVTFLRSSAKPFQILPFLEHGGQKAFNLSKREIALICASHSGTDEHIEVVRQIQAKVGIKENDLLCGVHPPFYKPVIEAMYQRGQKPGANNNNCSGKHTGMVAHAKLHDLDYCDYVNFDHPIQKEILATFSEMCDVNQSDVQLGIDGCSAPNFAIPLSNAALGIARMMQPDDLPSSRAEQCHLIVESMTSNPVMVGGPESFDTHLMRATGGRILAKGGAEGYLLVGIPPGARSEHSPALGIVIKIADGDQRGSVRPAVMLEVLRQLDLISLAELESLGHFGPNIHLYNWRKLKVGSGRVNFKLQPAD